MPNKNLNIKWFPITLGKKFINHVPNLCSLLKSSRKKISVAFLNFFLNAMITKIKIHSTFDIIEISEYMDPNKCIQKIYENVHLNVSYDFSKFDGCKKIKVWRS